MLKIARAPSHVLFSFLLTISFFCSSALAAPEFTFGYITDLTSRGAMLGKRSIIGVKIAEQELGDKVRVIIDDHQTDAKVAASQAQRLISIDKVDALLCDLTMPCIAASEVARRAKIPFFYQSTSQSVLDKNPYAFRNFIDYRDNCLFILRRSAPLSQKVRHPEGM